MMGDIVLTAEQAALLVNRSGVIQVRLPDGTVFGEIVEWIGGPSISQEEYERRIRETDPKTALTTAEVLRRLQEME